MSFMKGDRLSLDLGQYFKIYIFLCMCNNITTLAFKYIRTNALYSEPSRQRDSRAVAISRVRFLPLARAPHISLVSISPCR